MSDPAARRYDLDALRVGAFLLLILYHVGMFYVPWGWHVKSSHVVPELELWMGLLNPWRLTLLFVISGAATRFMLEKTSPGPLAVQRSQRLLIPLFVGMLVIVAPQSWAEAVEKTGYTGGFLEFWPRYLAFDQSFGIILPTYNHLWFVAYLWLYTMAALAVSPHVPVIERLSRKAVHGAGLFLLPIMLFGVYRATAHAAWGETHIVFADAYGHLQYGTAFALGFVLARDEAAWGALAQARKWTFGAGVALAFAGVSLARLGIEDLPGASGAAFAFLREAYAWMVICALFGFARVRIRRGSPLLSTLNEAVFPFYIVHQTAIVLAGHLLKPMALPATVEAAAILAITAASCLVAFALARRIPALRLPLGLKPIAKSVSSRAMPAAAE